MMQLPPSALPGRTGKHDHPDVGNGSSMRPLFFCIASLIVCSNIAHLGQMMRSHEAQPSYDESSDGDEEFCSTREEGGDTRPQCDDLRLFHTWSRSDRGVAAQLGLDDILTVGDTVLAAPETEHDIAGLLERSEEETPLMGTMTNALDVHHVDRHGVFVSSNTTAYVAQVSKNIVQQPNNTVSDTVRSGANASNITHKTAPGAQTLSLTNDGPSQSGISNLTYASSEEWSAGLKKWMEEMDAKNKDLTRRRNELNERIGRHMARMHATLTAALPLQNKSIVIEGLGQHETKWAHELSALQDKLESRSKQLRKMHEHHSGFRHEHDPILDPIKVTPPTGVLPNATGHVQADAHLAAEMDHWHAVRREAATLATSLATINDAHGGAWKEMADAAHDFVNVQAELEQKLRERHAAHTAAIRKAREALPGHHLRGYTERPATGHAFKANQDLEWARAAAWKTRTQSSSNASLGGINTSNGVVNISRSDLYGSHWKGKIPKVACVTLVPRGARGKAWMRYFIDNFKLQHYEGERQLYLIYHESDHATKQLVDKYVDGNTIKSGAVAGAELPSTVGFRYGSFLAVSDKADVVARWDFGGWYHPARMATQVHALAMSGRPMSVLGSWTFSDGVADHRREASGGSHNDGTIVGVASWMRRFWFPSRDGSLRGLQGKDLVRVNDAAELAVYDDQ